MLNLGKISNSKNIFLITTIISIIKILKCVNEENKIGSIIIKDGFYLAEEFNLTYTNKNNLRINKKTKICSITNKLDYDKYCKPFNKIYFDRWLIHTDNQTAIDELINNVENSVENYIYNIDSILVPDNLNISKYHDKEFPFLSISKKNFDEMKKYDFRSESQNYFAYIKYDKSDIYQPWDFLVYTSLAGFSLSLLIVIIWHVRTYKYYRIHSTPLQKTLSALPYITVVYALCLYNYFKTLENSDDDKNLNIRSYLITILITLSSIYRTIFWFLIIIISYGWQIYKFNLQREEMRKFIGIYIFIYLTVCFDQIIDSIINTTFFGFRFSEIKNLIIYSIFSGTIVTKTLFSLKILNTKLTYARNLATEFVPGLSLKISIIKYHMIISILYTVFYIMMIVLIRLNISKLNIELILLIANFLLEFFIMNCFLIVHRSRIYPDYYTLDIYNNEEQEAVDIKILSVQIPKLRKLKTANNSDFNGFIGKPTKNEKKDLIENNMRRPLIIINPIFDSEINLDRDHVASYDSRQQIINSNIDNDQPKKNINISDKLSVGFIV